MILTAISAIWVQAKKKPAQMSPEKKPVQEKSETRPGPNIIIHDNCPNPQPIRKRRAPQNSGDATHLEVHATTVYYSKDGFKTGIFHVDKHCSHLKPAMKVYVSRSTSQVPRTTGPANTVETKQQVQKTAWRATAATLIRCTIFRHQSAMLATDDAQLSVRI